MKITINTDSQYTDTEIVINCPYMSKDIEKMLSTLRMYDVKLTGHKEGRQYIIEAENIIYIESIDKHSFLYTLNDIFESPFRLYELETKLSDSNFLRASKNCLFNINHIQSIEPDLDRRLILTMEKDIKIIVSRQYAEAVKQILEACNG